MNQQQPSHRKQPKGHIAHCSAGRLRFKLSTPNLSVNDALTLFENQHGSLAEDIQLKYSTKSKRYLATYTPSQKIEQCIISTFQLESLTSHENDKTAIDFTTLSLPLEKLESLLPVKEIAQESALYFAIRLLIPSPLKPYWAIWKAYPFLAKGITSLLKKEIDADLLNTVTLAALFATKNFNGTSDLAFVLKLCAQLAEKVAEIEKLHSSHLHLLDQNTNWIESQGMPTPVSTGQLKKNDLLIVYAGNRIPVDGTIEKGMATISPSLPFNNESTQNFSNGDRVFAGDRVEKGQLFVRAERVANNTRYAKVLQTITAAQNNQSEIQTDALKFAETIYPASVLLSGLSFLITKNISLSLSLLLINPARTIKFAAPLALDKAIVEASHQGALFKGTQHIESLAKSDVVVFDINGMQSSDISITADFHSAVQTLKASGIRKIILMNHSDKNNNIRQLRITRSYTNLSSARKKEIVLKLQQQGRHVAYISDSDDSDNDSLTCPDISISVNPSAITVELKDDLTIYDNSLNTAANMRLISEQALQRTKTQITFAGVSSSVLMTMGVLTNTPAALLFFLHKMSEIIIQLSSLQPLLIHRDMTVKTDHAEQQASSARET